MAFRSTICELQLKIIEAEVEVKAKVEAEVEAEVKNAPHKAQKNTEIEIEDGSQKIEACRDARSCVSPT